MHAPRRPTARMPDEAIGRDSRRAVNSPQLRRRSERRGNDRSVAGPGELFGAVRTVGPDEDDHRGRGRRPDLPDGSRRPFEHDEARHGRARRERLRLLPHALWPAPRPKRATTASAAWNRRCVLDVGPRCDDVHALSSEKDTTHTWIGNTAENVARDYSRGQVRKLRSAWQWSRLAMIKTLHFPAQGFLRTRAGDPGRRPSSIDRPDGQLVASTPFRFRSSHSVIWREVERVLPPEMEWFRFGYSMKSNCFPRPGAPGRGARRSGSARCRPRCRGSGRAPL